jgi:hypothetical protein
MESVMTRIGPTCTDILTPTVQRTHSVYTDGAGSNNNKLNVKEIELEDSDYIPLEEERMQGQGLIFFFISNQK